MIRNSGEESYHFTFAENEQWHNNNNNNNDSAAETGLQLNQAKCEIIMDDFSLIST